MKRILIFSFLIYAMVCRTFAQENSSLPQVVLPTPQSQIFEKYVKHPTVEYNGIPEIVIPLYEIEVKGMKIPISLSYHAGGIKFGQYDGDVGAGWSINAGGFKVTRTIYGQPDETKPMYDEAELDAIPGLPISAFEDKKKRDRFLLGLERKFWYGNDNIPVYDSQHDIFTYMLPSTTNQYIISNRANRTVLTSEQNGDKVILDEGKSVLSLGDIKILDNNGFTYLLGGKQADSYLIETTETGVNSVFIDKVGWPLRQIQSPYGENIDFTYKRYEQEYTNRYGGSFTLTEAPVYGDLATYESRPSSRSARGDVQKPHGHISQFYIDQITTDKEIIIFKRRGFTESNITIDYVLTEIEIRTKENELINTI